MLVGTSSSSVPHCPQSEEFAGGIGDGLDNIDSSSSSSSDGEPAQEPLDQSFTCKAALLTRLGYCLTVVLLQIVGRIGLLRITHCFP